MQKNEKSKLTAIGKNKIFRSIITKLILQEELSEREKIYILTCAILFLKVYQADMRLISYADFAYSIILRYSLTSGDYRPLYDFSVNFGFYPITEAILKQNLVEQNIEDSFIRSELESFRHQSGYIETFHQSDQRKKFMDDKAHEKAYIAPTSFGKSSIIADYIKIHGDRKQKIAIIVPSKSLLVQTYNDLKQEGLKKRILIHNEMYNGEDSFIAVFTQERALRLLNRNRNAYFDILIIDEAHNLLKGADERSLLLARLINFNKQRNHLQEVIYLSPLIQKAESLRVSEGQQISKYLIGFNVKEPELFEYTTEGKKFVYNRFINQFYEIGESKNKIEYIKENSGEKTFIYVTSPPRIEEFALELTNNCPKIEASERIEELKRIISKEVHEDFYILESLDAGIIYLHGMLPDLLKEYLEYKFKQIPEIKYVIANMVILEGINLPIDTLFICHFYLLHGKRLMNLIGRVNRLNEIFNKNHVNLRKLIPNIHIVNNRSYTDVHNPKFKELRSRIFADEISNPVLSSYKLEEDIKTKDKVQRAGHREKILAIQENETFLTKEPQSETEIVRHYFINNGLNRYYKNLEFAISNFISNKNAINHLWWDESRLMDKVQFLFIKGSENNIDNNAFLRLQNQKALNYYENYILINLKQSLKQNIQSQFAYFRYREEANDPYLYVGKSYGNYSYNPHTEEYTKDTGNNMVYMKIPEKNDKELINYAVIKIKLEENFISFTLTKFFEAMLDFNLILEDEYNKYIYGTTNRDKIVLTRTGLSMSLISRLEADDQLKNLRIDEYNNISPNKNFVDFLNRIDDFYKFEIGRYLSF